MIQSWNKRWLKLRSKSCGFPAQLEKYQDEATANIGGDHSTCDLDTIRYVDRIKESRKKHAIQIVLDDLSSFQFALDSELEAENWLSALQETVFGISGSQGGRDVFEVYMMKSSSLNASGECLLQVTADEIRLLDIDNPQRLQLSWPLSSIRRYSVERGIFRIETGRSSPTGEGQFLFDSEHSSDIYDKVRKATEALGKAKAQSQASKRDEAEKKYHTSMNNGPAKNFVDQPPPYTPTDRSIRNKHKNSEETGDDEWFTEPERQATTRSRTENGKSSSSRKPGQKSSTPYELEQDYDSAEVLQPSHARQQTGPLSLQSADGYADVAASKKLLAQGGASKSHVSSGTNASSHSQRVKATGNESKIRKGNQGDEDDADSCPEEPAPVPVPPRSSRKSNDLQNASKAAASSRNKSASVEEQQYYASSETYYSPSELQRDENDEDGAYYVASNQHGGRGMSAPGKKPTVRH